MSSEDLEPNGETCEVRSVASSGMVLYTFMANNKRHHHFKVKSKLGFLWGVSIGEAKRMRENPYEDFNMEYEYHTKRSAGKHPATGIIFAVLRAENKR